MSCLSFQQKTTICDKLFEMNLGKRKADEFLEEVRSELVLLTQCTTVSWYNLICCLGPQLFKAFQLQSTGVVRPQVYYRMSKRRNYAKDEGNSIFRFYVNQYLRLKLQEVDVIIAARLDPLLSDAAACEKFYATHPCDGGLVPFGSVPQVVRKRAAKRDKVFSAALPLPAAATSVPAFPVAAADDEEDTVLDLGESTGGEEPEEETEDEVDEVGLVAATAPIERKLLVVVEESDEEEEEDGEKPEENNLPEQVLLRDENADGGGDVEENLEVQEMEGEEKEDAAPAEVVNQPPADREPEEEEREQQEKQRPEVETALVGTNIVRTFWYRDKVYWKDDFQRLFCYETLRRTGEAFLLGKYVVETDNVVMFQTKRRVEDSSEEKGPSTKRAKTGREGGEKHKRQLQALSGFVQEQFHAMVPGGMVNGSAFRLAFKVYLSKLGLNEMLREDENVRNPDFLRMIAGTPLFGDTQFPAGKTTLKKNNHGEFSVCRPQLPGDKLVLVILP